jgi:hypothetical protein
MCPLIKIIVLYSSSSFPNKISTCQDYHLKLTPDLKDWSPQKWLFICFFIFSNILFPHLQQMYGGGSAAGAGARAGPLCMGWRINICCWIKFR